MVVINIHLLAVDQHYNHRPLINAVGVGVAQHPFFLGRIPEEVGQGLKFVNLMLVHTLYCAGHGQRK